MSRDERLGGNLDEELEDRNDGVNDNQDDQDRTAAACSGTHNSNDASSTTIGQSNSAKRSGNKSGQDGQQSLNPVSNTPRSDGSYGALATPLRDQLIGQDDVIGGTANSSTVFTWKSLTDSVLKGPRNSVLWDRVKGFGSLDKLDAPATVVTREITNLSGSVDKLIAGQINAKGVGAANFAPNTAAAFSFTDKEKRDTGVFVVFNDGVAGYQQKHDSLIFLSEYTFAPIHIY